MHYLERRDDVQGLKFSPCGHNCKTNSNQYVYVSYIVLSSLTAYVSFAQDEDSAAPMTALFKAAEQAISEVFDQTLGSDGDRVSTGEAK